MRDAFYAALEACDPALGRFRAYRIEAGTDLVGDWLSRDSIPHEVAEAQLVRSLGLSRSARFLQDYP